MNLPASKVTHFSTLSSKRSEGSDPLLKFLELYRRHNLVVIPLSPLSKVPLQNFNLERVYNTGQVEYDWEDHTGNIAVVSGFNNLLVIDCDSQEAITWLESQEEFIPTATVKTRRGHHYWYYLYNVPNEFEKRSFKLGDIEFLLGRRYAVAPPSTVKHNELFHQYTFIDGYDVVKHELNIALLDFEAFQKLLDKAHKRAGKKYETEQVKHTAKQYAIDADDQEKLTAFLQIVQLSKQYYTEGLRQTIWMALAGVARKLHLPKETVEEILVKELYEELKDDDSKKQRLSAIEETYKKPIEKIAGISILIQHVFNEEDAQTALNILNRCKEKTQKTHALDPESALSGAQEVVKHMNRTFVLINNYWYWLIENDEGKKFIPICSGFLIKDRGFKISTNEPVFIVYNCETRRIGRISLNLTDLQNFLGRPVLNAETLKFLLDALIKRHKEKLFVNEIGWYKTGSKRVFIHPLNQSTLLEHNLYCDLEQRDAELFKYINVQKQHEVVRKLLAEGKWLGVKVILGVASLFIDENLQGYTVFDIGPRGTGKTTSSQFIMSLFYNIHTPVTLNATETGFELYMRKFHNLPILFDETALVSDSKLQERVFKVALGTGKLRGTKNLSVDLTLLKSVVFVTGEVDPNFERRGAERRYIIVPAESWENYTEKFTPAELHKIMQECCGCGFDYIKFLEEHDVEIKIKLSEEFRIFTFTRLIEKSLNFVAKFYNLSYQEISNLEKSLHTLLSYQLEKVDLSLEKFLSDFAEFLLSRANHFVIRNTLSQSIARNYIYGELDPEEQKLYITREGLEKFKEFVRLDLRTILKLFENAEVLIPVYVSEKNKTKKKYTKARRIKYMDTSFVASVYEFDLKKISEIIQEPFTSAMLQNAEKTDLDDDKIPF